MKRWAELKGDCYKKGGDRHDIDGGGWDELSDDVSTEARKRQGKRVLEKRESIRIISSADKEGIGRPLPRDSRTQVEKCLE